MSDTSATLFVVRIGPPELADVESKMSAVVSGTLSPFSDLDGITDWAAVKKVGLPPRSITGIDLTVPSV